MAAQQHEIEIVIRLVVPDSIGQFKIVGTANEEAFRKELVAVVKKWCLFDGATVVEEMTGIVCR